MVRQTGRECALDYRINENGQVVSYDNSTEDYYTDVLSKQATDFLRRAMSDSSRPFFMYVAPTAPHEPATPAERHKDAFAEEKAPRPPSFDEEDVSDKPSEIRNSKRFSDAKISLIDEDYRRRLSSMLAVDEMVASLLEELQAAGKLDDTFIFFTSITAGYKASIASICKKTVPTRSLPACPSSLEAQG